jgi:RNA polymerase sigma-70 factor, ECF subfamily
VFQSQSQFEQTVMPHAPALLRFARRLYGGGQAAEDLVQETLLLAWRGFGQLAEESNARAWLFRILINVSYEKGRRARTSPETVPLTVELGLGVAARTRSSTERLEVQQALAGLSVEQRAVLLLTIVEGFTCREVAEILRLPLGTVTSRLSRGRLALREVLSGVRSAKGF